MTVPTITTELDAAVLATRIQDPDRMSTLLVVTTPTTGAKPLVDIKTLAAGLDPDTIVKIVPADWTRALEQRLGPDAAVWGGAVRSYPAGAAPHQGRYWKPDPTSTPATFARQILHDLHPTPSTETSHPHQMTPASSSSGPSNTTAGPSREITTPTQANTLADHLLDPRRARPVVLVSVPAGRREPWCDVALIQDSVGTDCDVVVLHTGAASQALAARLPRGCEAYGGAARVYPLGSAWLNNWDAAPLRFAFDAHDATAQTRALISDAWSVTHARGATTTTPEQTQSATGIVVGLAGGRGIVRLDTGQNLAIWPEMIAPDLEAHQLLSTGMSVSGTLQPGATQLDITTMRTDPLQALGHYRHGDHVLVKVTDIATDHLTVALMPTITGTIHRDQVTTTALPLGDLISPGEVLVARIQTSDPWTLSLDVDDTQPLHPAPPLLAGGPAWLQPPTPDPDLTPRSSTDQVGTDQVGTDQVGTDQVGTDQVGTDQAGTDQAGTDEATTAELGLPDHRDTQPAQEQEQHTPQEQNWQAERAQLAEQLHRTKSQARHARTEAREARTRLRTALAERDRATAALARLKEHTGRTADDSQLFTDPIDQLRFEINLAWARRIPAGQKHELPLKPFEITRGFLSTLEDVQGIDRGKVVDVIVEICTGLVAQLDSRELHQLRSSEGGGTASVVRGDGAVCWRVALQRGTSSARRLHFWQRTDGVIELSSIRLHDDTRP